jgi:MYXO-CTERM domain-containing protein
MLKHLSIACVLAASAAPLNAALLASSIADYSAVQGQNGWYYGYYDVGSPLAATFQPMTEFDGTRWWVDSSRYWTMIGPVGAHANGLITSGFATPDEQWAARRWVSSITSLVDVDAVFAKLNVNPASNGVTGRIYVDGTEIWNQTIGATDSTGASPSFQLSVVPGTTIDFILDPHDSNDWSDNTQFSAVVTSVPAPAAAALLGLAGITATRRRRPIR